MEEIKKRFIFTKKIGSGTEGPVFLAHDLKAKHNVAIKYLDYIDAEDRARREFELCDFFEETSHFPIYYGFYTIDPSHVYLVMEHIEGRHIDKKDTLISLNQKLKLISGICCAVKILHDHKVAHRDISDNNIMLRKNSNKIVLLDFGFATSEYLCTGLCMGTTSFVSPQMMDVGNVTDYWNVSLANDVWAVGIMAFYLLLGKMPYWCGKEPEDVIPRFVEISRTPIEYLDYLTTECKRKYGNDTIAYNIITQMLKFDYKKRSTAAQLRDYLKTYLKSQ